MSIPPFQSSEVVVAYFALSSDSSGIAKVRTNTKCFRTLKPGDIKHCHVPKYPPIIQYTVNCSDGGTYGGTALRGQFINIKCPNL